MRFAFRALPSASGGALTPRPVVDIALEGLEVAPIACLLDTGALRTRMSAEIAPLAGIELTGDLTEEFYVGGVKTAGQLARHRGHRRRTEADVGEPADGVGDLAVPPGPTRHAGLIRGAESRGVEHR